MGTSRSRTLKAAWLILVLHLLPIFSGCMQDNDADFLKNAPPGRMSEFPGESVAQRRSRTRNMSKVEQRYEAKRKAAEKAAEANATAKP